MSAPRAPRATSSITTLTSSSTTRLVFYVVAPIVLVLAVTAAIVAHAFWNRVKLGKDEWRRVAFFRALRPALVIAFGTFPVVASMAFGAFSCEALDDDSQIRYLPPDYVLECGPVDNPTPAYKKLIEVAWVAIFIYPVGITIATSTLLYKVPRAGHPRPRPPAPEPARARTRTRTRV